MANNHTAPGVQGREIPTLPGVVTDVSSAVPAFIGYTEKTRYDGRNLEGIPEYIASFKDFEERFGGADVVRLDGVDIAADARGRFAQVEGIRFKKRFLLYEAIYLYFANGGGECYVVSLGAFEEHAGKDYAPEGFLAAIDALRAVDDVTLLVMPEAALLGSGFYTVQQHALAHCAERMNRFALLDLAEKNGGPEGAAASLLLHWKNAPDAKRWRADYQEFRNRIGLVNLSYGAAYTPYLVADVPTRFDYRDFKDLLFRAGTQEKPERLELENLDPASRQGVKNLDAVLGDSANLDLAARAIREAMDTEIENPDPSRAAPGERGATGGGGIGAIVATLFGCLAGAPYTGTGAVELPEDMTPGPLSKDMAQYLVDQLRLFLPKIRQLGAGDGTSTAPGDVKELLEAWKTAVDGIGGSKLPALGGFLDDLFGNTGDTVRRNTERLVDGLSSASGVYRSIHAAIRTALRVQPPSAAMAGLYAATDRARGVWKAPANVGVSGCLALVRSVTAEEQEALNSDSVAGKSINALRSFPGKGHLVWGARTLDGNSPEWRYIPVRRFFIMVEESVRRATASSVFEPNDATLWAKVKAMVDNYLLLKWKDGALAGASPVEAYMVNVGLGSTMTEQDILDGRLIVDIGMAVVRPAEFIILRLTHKMQQG